MALIDIRKISCILLLILMLIFPGSHFQNSIAISEWKQTAEPDFANGTMNNVNLDNAGMGTELRLKNPPMEWVNKTPSPHPIPTHFSEMASIWGTDKILYFPANDGFLIDRTWIYDYSSNTWNQSQPENQPNSSYFNMMASIWGTDKVLLYDGHYSNETWVFDQSDNNWINQKPLIQPPPRYDTSVSSIHGTDKVLLFGGYIFTAPDIHHYFNDTWIYDLSDNTWMEIKPLSRPAPLFNHMLAPIWGTDKILIFNGVDNIGILSNESYIFDYGDNTWTRLESLTRPLPIYSSSMTSVWGTDKIILFGGRNQFAEEFNQTWMFDLSDDKWTEIKVSLAPHGRYWHGFASVWGTDKIVMAGGAYWHSGEMTSKYLEDTWILKSNLHIYLQNGTFISTPHDTNYNSSFKMLNWSGDTPPDTDIKFQLRTALSKAHLDEMDFVGPDGSNRTFYTSSDSTIWVGHYSDRWVQYKVYLSTTNISKTPFLKNVTIVFNNLPKTVLLSPINNKTLLNNTPIFEWDFIDLDSDHQTTFQVLIDNESSFYEVDFDSGEQATPDNSWQFPNGTSFQSLPDGIWYWKVRTRDSDSDWGEYSSIWEIFINATVPISNITIPENDYYYQTISSINGTAFEKDIGSGLKKVEIKIKRFSDNYTWSELGWTPSVNWLMVNGTDIWHFDTTSITWSSGEKYNAQSRAIDNISNIEIPKPGIEFYFDNERPNSTIEFPLNGIYLNQLESIYGTAFDRGGSGLKNVRIIIQRLNDSKYWAGSDWQSQTSWLDTVGITSWSFDTGTVPWETDQWYTIISRSEDNLGKIELSTDNATFMYDTKAPENLFISINNNSTYTNLTEAILTLDSFDSGSGVSQMALSSDAVSWSDWEPYKAEFIIELLPDDGEQHVYFKVQDRAGNSAEYISDEIILDRAPPEQLSFVINEDSIYANNSIVTINVIAVDALSGLDKMCFSVDGQSWTDWENYTNKTTFELSEPDEEKTIHLKVKDGAGNPAQTKDSIILDTAPPKFMVIVINEGAETTNSTKVDLLLNAEDLTSGLRGISFSTDGSTWTEWEDYTENRIFQLPEGDGTKKVYYRAIDNAGNIANPKIGTIVLNTSINEKPSDEVPPDQTEDVVSTDPNSTMLFIILILVMIVITIFFLYMKRRTRRSEPRSDDEPDIDQTNGSEEPGEEQTGEAKDAEDAEVSEDAPSPGRRAPSPDSLEAETEAETESEAEDAEDTTGISDSNLGPQSSSESISGPLGTSEGAEEAKEAEDSEDAEKTPSPQPRAPSPGNEAEKEEDK